MVRLLTTARSQLLNLVLIGPARILLLRQVNGQGRTVKYQHPCEIDLEAFESDHGWFDLVDLFHVVNVVCQCIEAIVVRVQSQDLSGSESLAGGTKVATLRCQLGVNLLPPLISVEMNAVVIQVELSTFSNWLQLLTDILLFVGLWKSDCVEHAPR